MEYILPNIQEFVNHFFILSFIFTVYKHTGLCYTDFKEFVKEGQFYEKKQSSRFSRT